MCFIGEYGKKGWWQIEKAIAMGCILLMLITCGGCVIATDFYAGKRPYDYGKATWVCELPDAWFVVNTPEDDKDYIYPQGEIATDNKNIKFTISFGHGEVASFADENDNVILLGTCRFSHEKLIITVDKESDKLFNGQYDTITFVRNAGAS